MDWVSDAASKRQFEGFAAEASDSLLRTGYLMTGNVRDAEDLVQETFLRVARRWNRVRSMDRPAAYARRILINLVLDDAGRRSRQQAELGPRDGGVDAADESATRALREVDDLAEFRWALVQLPARQRAVLVLRYWENCLMPTDELESQLRSTLARAAADFEHPDQARQRLLQRDYHPRRGNRRLAAGITTGAALVVGLVAVIAAVGHGPATKVTPLAAPALRARLLAAIDTASGDILYTHGGPAPGGGTWQSPAYPQPGQKVHIPILGLESGGAIVKDGEYSFTMPSGNDGAHSYTSNLDQGGLQLSGTVLDVNHVRHLWGEWHSKFILGFTLDAAGIRAEIANGQFKVIGSTELHGQKAVEMGIDVPPDSEAPPHVTAARLWVDATTYLPMQQFVRMSNGQQNVTGYTFLPRTAENRAKLRPEIPAGYTRAGRAQMTGPEPKAKAVPR